MRVTANKDCFTVASPMTAQPHRIPVPAHTFGEMWPNHNTMTQEFRWVRWWGAQPMLMYACDLRLDSGKFLDAPVPFQILQRDYGRVMTKISIVNGSPHNYWGLSGTIPAGQWGVVIKDEVFSSSEKFLARLYCVFDGFPEIVCLRESHLDIPSYEDIS